MTSILTVRVMVHDLGSWTEWKKSMHSHHFQASENHDCDHLPHSPATMPSLKDGMHPQTLSQDKVFCKLLLSGI